MSGIRHSRLALIRNDYLIFLFRYFRIIEGPNCKCLWAYVGISILIWMSPLHFYRFLVTIFTSVVFYIEILVSKQNRP